MTDEERIERIELILISIYDSLPKFIREALPKPVTLLIEQTRKDMQKRV
jgi:hypothetical protein